MKISSRRYFQYRLCAPILIPLLLFPFRLLWFGFFLLGLSLAFGGVPYLFYGTGLFFLMKRVSSTRAIRWLTLLVPPLFIPVQALFCMAVTSIWESRLAFECEYLGAFAAYILLIGYGYVAVINAGYWGVRKLGWIDDS